MITMLDLPGLLSRLSRKRPLFHSEADFQHALAWEIHHKFPDAKVRLEYRPSSVEVKMYVDIWVVMAGGKTWAIELKYKTRSLDVVVEGKRYRLLNQSAQDIARYDFLRDVVRLERITQTSSEICGAAILLTNDTATGRLRELATR